MSHLPIGHSFQVFDTIPSTNLYAMQAIREGLAEHGMAWYALQQTQGRGQRGKTWWSAAGENIALSIALKTSEMAASQHFRLVVAMALGAADWLQNAAPGPWCIKWPNDLYWNDRKAGGILIENLMQANQWSWAVVGFGVNMNSRTFNPSLPNPISLANITGGHFDPEAEARKLCQHLEFRWKQLAQGGFELQWQQYNALLYGRGKICRLRVGNVVAPYFIHSIDQSGHLLAGTNGEYRFAHGEVVWELPLG